MDESPTPPMARTTISACSANSWLLAAILGLQVWISFGQIPRVIPRAWEYSIKSIPDDNFDYEMNKMGQEGWEMVFARRAGSGDSDSPTFSYEMIFKRPK